MKALVRRVTRLELRQPSPAHPGYVCGVDVDDLQAQLQALPGAGRLTGYITVSPDVWERDA